MSNSRQLKLKWQRGDGGVDTYDAKWLNYTVRLRRVQNEMDKSRYYWVGTLKRCNKHIKQFSDDSFALVKEKALDAIEANVKLMEKQLELIPGTGSSAGQARETLCGEILLSPAAGTQP